ncbi:MAG: hypothetical protein AAF125_19040, partial [Chloroflexota bacterium]
KIYCSSPVMSTDYEVLGLTRGVWPEWHCRTGTGAQVDLGLSRVCFYTSTNLERFKFFALQGDEV